MILSPAGLLFIARYEGYRRFVYNDGAGYATIGYGHLLGPWARRNTYRLRYPAGLSPAAALRVLRADASAAQRAVQQYARHDLLQHQFDALCSFTFNCGAGALAHSTLLRDVNAKAAPEVVRADFARWNHAGGRVMEGLTRRREAEADIYVHGSAAGYHA